MGMKLKDSGINIIRLYNNNIIINILYSIILLQDKVVFQFPPHKNLPNEKFVKDHVTVFKFLRTVPFISTLKLLAHFLHKLILKQAW